MPNFDTAVERLTVMPQKRRAGDQIKVGKSLLILNFISLEIKYTQWRRYTLGYNDILQPYDNTEYITHNAISEEKLCTETITLCSKLSPNNKE